MNPTWTDTQLDQQARDRRVRTAVVVTVVGLLILAAAGVIAWSWRAELPDPVASHWGSHGTVNGFSSLGGLLATLLGIGGALVLGFGAMTGFLGQSAANRRIGAAAAIWAALWIATLLLGTLSVQRGLTDARDAGDVGNVLGIALAASLVPAILVGVFVPGDPHRPTERPVAADAPRVRLLGAERAVWLGRASSPIGFIIGVPVAVAIVVIAVTTGLWWLLAEVGVIVLLFIGLSSFVVRVDDQGLSIRSTVGWPRTRVPLDEVVRADVATVSPVRDFGGWGWRTGRDGRVGIVLRKGEALLVQRTGDRSIVVTVDDAASAAGLLNALSDRQRQGR